jgi:hypothetical protein
MYYFLYLNFYGDLMRINAKKTKLSKKGRSKTNHEIEEYPFLHIRSNTKVQKRI